VAPKRHLTGQRPKAVKPMPKTKCAPATPQCASGPLGPSQNPHQIQGAAVAVENKPRGPEPIPVARKGFSKSIARKKYRGPNRKNEFPTESKPGRTPAPARRENFVVARFCPEPPPPTAGSPRGLDIPFPRGKGRGRNQSRFPDCQPSGVVGLKELGWLWFFFFPLRKFRV